MKNIFNRISKFFKNRQEERDRLKDIIITARGGFEKKSEHIFRNKEKALANLRYLDKIVRERMKRQQNNKNGKT